MKAYKIELLIVDSESIGEKDIKKLLENCKYIYPTVMDIKSADIGEFHDDHPLNQWDTMEGEFKRIFN